MTKMNLEQRAKAAAKSTHPPTSILHPAWVYTPAAATNIAETFARIRAEQAKPVNVVKINREKAPKVR